MKLYIWQKWTGDGSGPSMSKIAGNTTRPLCSVSGHTHTKRKSAHNCGWRCQVVHTRSCLLSFCRPRCTPKYTRQTAARTAPCFDKVDAKASFLPPLPGAHSLVQMPSLDTGAPTSLAFSSVQWPDERTSSVNFPSLLPITSRKYPLWRLGNNIRKWEFMYYMRVRWAVA